MKVIVMSDTHRFLKNAEMVLERIGQKVDAVIHLGDHDSDAKRLEGKYSNIKFHYVGGNNDFGDSPTELVLKINGRKIFITHGHRYNVYFSRNNIYYRALEVEAEAALFGHTHTPYEEYNSGVLVFNPGSISLPRSYPAPTFGIIDIPEKGLIKASLMIVEGNNFRLS